jgi:hypothetical protein
LAAERVSYNPSTGVGQWFVKLSNVSVAADTVIYIAYGLTGLSDPNADAIFGKTVTWDNTYLGVWHMQENTGSVLNDSTANGNAGAITGGAWGANGPLGVSLRFNGATPTSVDFGDPAIFDDLHHVGYSYEMWARFDNNGVSQAIYSKSGHRGGAQNAGAGSGEEYFFDVDWTGADAIARSGTGVIASNTFYALAGTFNTSKLLTIYQNGVSKGTSTAAGASSSDAGVHLFLGKAIASSGDMTGYMAEFRLSKVARSVDALLTSYNNQNIPDKNNVGGFYTIGSESGPSAGDIFAFIGEPQTGSSQIQGGLR